MDHDSNARFDLSLNGNGNGHPSNGRVYHSAPVSPRSRHTEMSAMKSNALGALPEKESQVTLSFGESNANKRSFHPEASLVLVGIRGCGKRSLGLIAATALGRRFITEDHFFQSTTGLSRQDYLKVHGSEEFHKQDVEISRRMLEENRTKCVIDCGLGSLTSGLQEYLKLYSNTNPVVYIIRDMKEIKALLNLGERSARLLENGDPSHRKCSNFEFFNLQEECETILSDDGTADLENPDRASPTYSFKLRQAQADFSHFVRFITGSFLDKSNFISPYSVDIPVESRPYTHALEVKFSDYEAGILDFTALESGGDVVEICVDRWHHAAPKSLSQMTAAVRRALNIPIILSARREPTNMSPDMYIAILLHGLRLGVEFLSVDLDLDNRRISNLVSSKGFTRIIGTYIDTASKELGWRGQQWVEKYDKAIMLKLDMVRLLQLSRSRTDGDALNWFIQEMRTRSDSQIPIIAYNIGPFGRSSQLFNPILTSVTHPNLQKTAIARKDNQEPLITSQGAITALFYSYVLDPLRFYIVGGNVSRSLSPPMHNTAYKILGLHHHYSTNDVTTWEDIESLSRDDNLGGLSVVQPWKVRIVEKISAMSHHAKVIGAVNTLLPLRSDFNGNIASLTTQAYNRNRAGRVVGWYGDNTDFIGIKACLEKSLSPRNVIQPKTCGLVIGAGGMARAAIYAMLQMGCKNIFIHNRTPKNAQNLALYFNEWIRSRNGSQQMLNSEPVRVLESVEDPWPASFAQATMIVSCVTHELIGTNTGSDFQLPDAWIQSDSGGVVLEMAYHVKETPLLKQMKQFRKPNGLPWVIVGGIEALLEQAIAQFEIMTGRKAPRRSMRDALRDASE